MGIGAPFQDRRTTTTYCRRSTKLRKGLPVTRRITHSTLPIPIHSLPLSPSSSSSSHPFWFLNTRSPNRKGNYCLLLSKQDGIREFKSFVVKLRFGISSDQIRFSWGMGNPAEQTRCLTSIRTHPCVNQLIIPKSDDLKRNRFLVL